MPTNDSKPTEPNPGPKPFTTAFDAEREPEKPLKIVSEERKVTTAGGLGPINNHISTKEHYHG